VIVSNLELLSSSETFSYFSSYFFFSFTSPINFLSSHLSSMASSGYIFKFGHSFLDILKSSYVLIGLWTLTSIRNFRLIVNFYNWTAMSIGQENSPVLGENRRRKRRLVVDPLLLHHELVMLPALVIVVLDVLVRENGGGPVRSGERRGRCDGEVVARSRHSRRVAAAGNDVRKEERDGRHRRAVVLDQSDVRLKLSPSVIAY
jgi:hypothetical protein